MLFFSWTAGEKAACPPDAQVVVGLSLRNQWRYLVNSASVGRSLSLPERWRQGTQVGSVSLAVGKREGEL